MKKNYIKPMIDFDSFELSNNFAATCAATPNFDSGACPVILGGVPCFTSETQACKFKVTDGYSNICYYVPSGDNNLFGS